MVAFVIVIVGRLRPVVKLLVAVSGTPLIFVIVM